MGTGQHQVLWPTQWDAAFLAALRLHLTGKISHTADVRTEVATGPMSTQRPCPPCSGTAFMLGPQPVHVQLQQDTGPQALRSPLMRNKMCDFPLFWLHHQIAAGECLRSLARNSNLLQLQGAVFLVPLKPYLFKGVKAQFLEVPCQLVIHLTFVPGPATPENVCACVCACVCLLSTTTHVMVAF